MRLQRIALVAAVSLALCLAPSSAFAADKEPKTYPEHGTVIATRIDRRQGNNLFTGKPLPPKRIPVARIQTDKEFFDLEGQPALVVGQAVTFRVQGDSAYISQGSKEHKYEVVAVELRQEPNAR